MEKKQVAISDGTISLFAVLNFVFAGLNFIWIAIISMAMIYGLFFSGDAGDELAAGILGSAILILPALLCFAVFAAAGLGLIRKKSYGFYLHIAGAVLAIFSCIGIIYTIPALFFALQPDFKDKILHPHSGTDQ